MNIFDDLNSLGLWDFRIESYGDGVLTILGSTDFDYYHKAEIRFHGVHFLECATVFSHARFGTATRDEADRILARADGIGGATVFSVWADGERSPGTRYFIVAERAECTIGTVYYYQRENLGPGERVASWVAHRRR